MEYPTRNTSSDSLGLLRIGGENWIQNLCVVLRLSVGRNSLDDVPGDLAFSPVVQPGRPWVGVIGEILNIFKGNALFEQGSDGGDAEGVGGEVGREPSVPNPPLEHTLHVVVGHRIGGKLAFPRDGSAEDGGILVVLGDSGGVEVAQEDLLQVVADRDFAVFAAFVVECEHPLVALARKILHPQPGYGPDS